MKLVILFLATVVLGGVAQADELGPAGPADPYGAPAAMPQRRAQNHPALRRFIMQRFDRNHDGRLEPRERRQAARALRRLARKLAAGEQGRGARMRKLIQKYDLDGDGNVGPGEMPPAMAQRLRRFDRDGNGWIDDDDFAR